MARGGDNLDIVLWLYKRTGEKYLMDLAGLLVRQTNQWHQWYKTGHGKQNAYPEHIVNNNQGLKTPPLFYLVTGKEEHKQGYGNAVDPDGWIWKKCGRVDGMWSGTEPLSNRSSTYGTELCAIVERILSDSIALRILGDPSIGDHIESTAYNCLAADLAPDIKGMRYYVLPNQPRCALHEGLGFINNRGGIAICPSPHSGYPCCRSNFHMGWPKFVHNMWMANSDGGLVAAAYGPNWVTADVGKSKTKVTIEQDTDYPFRETVTLTVKSSANVQFPLDLRVPRWCEKPAIKVNRQGVTGVKAGTFHRIDRTWKNGDKVTLAFPMEPRTSYWINESVAVKRGPLVYSLLIKEKEWISKKSFLDGKFHTYEIHPDEAWNYALIRQGGKFDIRTEVSDTMPTQPFRAPEAPVLLKLKAFITGEGGWGTFREKKTSGRAKEPPKSPVRMTGEAREIILVPYGSTEIRITQFPWTEK